MSPEDLISSLNPAARSSPESGIIAVVNHGRERAGLIPLWTGEGDLPTPSFIWEAATRSLAAGETFYTYQRGLPDLREALARYHGRVYGGDHDPERFFITGSGMQAIQIAVDLTTGAGAEILVPGPVWPNCTAACGIAGARAIEVPLEFGDNGWRLDIERLRSAVTDKTRAIFINSPNNPTGWVLGRDGIGEVLALARQHGLWIIADEIYGRFYYAGDRAPSFRDAADPDEKVLFANTFSKNWAMTGWRIGWIEAPAALGQTIENLIQYSTSGVAVFMQRAAIAALDRGDDFTNHLISVARRGREIVCDGLRSTGRARFAAPEGAFYLFFGIDGEPDTDRLGIRLVDEANIGLAPGRAFGGSGSGFMRLCFLRSDRQLEEAVGRLTTWVARNEN